MGWRPLIGAGKVSQRGWVPLTTNGSPSVLIRQRDEAVAVLSIDASARGIDRLRWVMVPDKLARLPR